MKRFDDWEQRLAEHLAAAVWKPFAWGVNDCCLFACDVVMAITGEDLAAEFRGKYDSALTAARAMRDFAGGRVEELADRIAQERGIQEVGLLFAQRGDVVLVPTPAGPALGIVAMDGWEVLAAAEENGASRTPLNQCLRAWRI